MGSSFKFNVGNMKKLFYLSFTYHQHSLNMQVKKNSFLIVHVHYEYLMRQTLVWQSLLCIASKYLYISSMLFSIYKMFWKYLHGTFFDYEIVTDKFYLTHHSYINIILYYYTFIFDKTQIFDHHQWHS